MLFRGLEELNNQCADLFKSVDVSHPSYILFTQGTWTISGYPFHQFCFELLKSLYGLKLFGHHVIPDNGHRAKYIKYGKQRAKGVVMNVSDLDDDYTLGIHLHDVHNIDDPEGFDKYFRFTILENCNPRDLPKKEHLWIQKMRSVYPHGLNLNSPFGLPLLQICRG